MSLSESISPVLEDLCLWKEDVLLVLVPKLVCKVGKELGEILASRSAAILDRKKAKKMKGFFLTELLILI